MKKFLRMCIARGFVWQRPDGWWVAGCGDVDSELAPKKIQRLLDEIREEDR